MAAVRTRERCAGRWARDGETQNKTREEHGGEKRKVMEASRKLRGAPSFRLPEPSSASIVQSKTITGRRKRDNRDINTHGTKHCRKTGTV